MLMTSAMMIIIIIILIMIVLLKDIIIIIIEAFSRRSIFISWFNLIREIQSKISLNEWCDDGIHFRSWFIHINQCLNIDDLYWFGRNRSGKKQKVFMKLMMLVGGNILLIFTLIIVSDFHSIHRVNVMCQQCKQCKKKVNPFSM